MSDQTRAVLLLTNTTTTITILIIILCASSIAEVISQDDFCFRNSCKKMNFKVNGKENGREPNRIREEHLSPGNRGQVYMNRKLTESYNPDTQDKTDTVSEKLYVDQTSVRYKIHHNHTLKLKGSKKKRKKLKRKKKARKKFKETQDVITKKCITKCVTTQQMENHSNSKITGSVLEETQQNARSVRKKEIEYDVKAKRQREEMISVGERHRSRCV
ncbi:uncharacterized protein LOC106881492 [Octopus bimaculoides]|uniref:uncharacterized protein LOC106881492 n=1 Tax=Octopus bimaculoides TaxID=37653 RepID=UPI00071E1F66|nr:uncharacterized protein LOC106881492 [Octopus bimaculoides]XP_052829983.1 uncharacterized protein LOC106881492 [Octopus bimaculoides]|eukprot:XP_014787381.1 PREDICTED: uncharacterized protein LOC106881492 [Octopus bimaculoides]